MYPKKKINNVKMDTKIMSLVLLKHKVHFRLKLEEN